MRLLPILLLAICCTAHAQQLPRTLLTDARTGKKVAFSEAVRSGKVTLISFWGTWCIPGKREVKTVAENITDWKKKIDFTYIAIAVDQPHTEGLAISYAHVQGWDFPVYVDAVSALKQQLHFHALPFILIIDASGKIVYTHTGFVDAATLFAELKKYASVR